MFVTIQQVIQTIKTTRPYLIAIAGVPGSGKSAIAQIIHKNIEQSKIVPMDGYHLYRNELNDEGIKRRGAEFTFSKQKFRKDIEILKKNREGKFPSFDHKNKDPVQENINIQKDVQFVIVEGLYLFYDNWELNKLWDLKIWIQCGADIAIERVAKRHLQAGIEPTLELSIERANNNDRKNLEEINNISNLNDVKIIVNQKECTELIDVQL